MALNTASATISFAKKLEEDSARFYENMAKRYARDEATLLALAKENRQNIIQIERAYYGVITDAIEGCFAFNINPEEYTFQTDLPENVSYADALDKAVGMEDKIIKFYSDAAQQSKSLMADVPRVFMMVAKKRGNRRAKLGALRRNI
jgi:rubrerythrin